MSPQTATTLDQPALLSIDGPVATITLNRPDAFNSINTPIAKCLEELAAQITKDDSIRVVVIEGSGRAFCGGGDIQVFGANMDNLAPVVSELLHHLHHFIAAIRRMPKIVISSVHGSAAGAGRRSRSSTTTSGKRRTARRRRCSPAASRSSATPSR